MSTSIFGVHNLNSNLHNSIQVHLWFTQSQQPTHYMHYKECTIIKIQSHLFIKNYFLSVLDKECLFYMGAALHVFVKTSIQTILSYKSFHIRLEKYEI